ncbi:MAG: hypothetical protein R3E86_21370 [Pseudomonadales bacterium]
MNHEYTDDDQGVWTNESGTVYCRWWWDPDRTTLKVERNGRSHSWVAPVIDARLSAEFRIDLAETAKDIAQFLERRIVA